MSTSALVVNIAVSVLSGAPEQKIIQEFEEANNMRELFFRAVRTFLLFWTEMLPLNPVR